MPIFTISDVTLDLPDEILSPDLIRWLTSGRYELQEARALAEFVKPEDVVMDIGAGVGFVSILAARIVGGPNVIAVEANPEDHQARFDLAQALYANGNTQEAVDELLDLPMV